MNKKDGFDLILKAAGVYLFVLAVAALPRVVGALVQIGMLSRSLLAVLEGEGSIGETLMATGVSSSITGILTFVLLIVVARNLFNGGSWVKRLLAKKDATQQEDGPVSSETPASDEPSS